MQKTTRAALKIYKARKRKNKISMALSMAGMVFGLFWLVWILFTLTINGIEAINWTLLSKATPPPGSDGGLFNAILGSILMAGTATIIGTPIGILAGTYLAEYGRHSWLSSATRFVNDILLSAPSIVLGLFVYTVYVAQVGHFSGFAGALALSLIVIPVVVHTTDDMLKLVPDSLREAAVALGAPKWKMITMISYRAARSGIATGVLLAVARISGETAPLLFTALNNQFTSSNMNAPMANLPAVIFQFAMSPYADWHRIAWGGAILITLSVLGLNILARVMFTQQSKEPKANAMNAQNQPADPNLVLVVRDLNFYYGKFHAIKNVSMDIQSNKVTAFIGPSGCGKSTLLRTFNRLHDLYPQNRATGKILLDGKNVLHSKSDPTMLRARVGMVFQKPTPFPMSIYDNIAFGVKLYENLKSSEMDERVEWALTKAALWNEVKDKLKQSGNGLSGGQQQRLCIARSIAIKPEVILLDEPCSALDPISTAHIEELIHEIKTDYTVVIVTHNMQQAARVSDFTAYMYLGELIEFDQTDKIFTKPNQKATEDYITGKFG